MTALNKVLIANLILLTVSVLIFFTSEKINRNTISLDYYSSCFDNFDEIIFCGLKNGMNVSIEQVPKNATLIIGDSHGLVFADVVRNSLSNDSDSQSVDRDYFFSGISSCLPVVDYQHEVSERQASCQTLGDVARDWEGDLIYAAKWLKYPNSYFQLLRDDALIIAQVPKFNLPPSAIPTRSRYLSKMKFSEYQAQQASYEIFFGSIFNPYEKVLCDQKECSMLVDGVYLYSDEHHLSSKGTLKTSKSVPDIHQKICKLLNGVKNHGSC